jgi:hypothetical protein
VKHTHQHVNYTNRKNCGELPRFIVLLDDQEITARH